MEDGYFEEGFREAADMLHIVNSLQLCCNESVTLFNCWKGFISVLLGVVLGMLPVLEFAR